MTFKKIISTKGVVRDGKLQIYDRETFLEDVYNNFHDEKIEMVVKSSNDPISNDLRSFYFAVVLPEFQKALYFSQGIHASIEDIDKTYLRPKYLFSEVYDPNTDNYTKIPHRLSNEDSEVNTRMMLDFIEMIRIEAAEFLDWSIPYPRENKDSRIDLNFDRANIN